MVTDFPAFCKIDFGSSQSASSATPVTGLGNDLQYFVSCLIHHLLHFLPIVLSAPYLSLYFYIDFRYGLLCSHHNWAETVIFMYFSTSSNTVHWSAPLEMMDELHRCTITQISVPSTNIQRFKTTWNCRPKVPCLILASGAASVMYTWTSLYFHGS